MARASAGRCPAGPCCLHTPAAGRSLEHWPGRLGQGRFEDFDEGVGANGEQQGIRSCATSVRSPPTIGSARCTSRWSPTRATSFDEFVSKPSFGSLLARSAENVAALSRIGSDFADLVLRNMRVAGRADITRLARQLQRTEDKLERVLQEVEQLRDELGDRAGSRRSNGGGPKAGARAKAQR